MSDQAFDPTQFAESIYSIGDVASDPAAAATALRALLGQLERQPGGQPGGHQAAGVGPGGSSAVVGGEALPSPQLEAFPIDRLDEHVDDIARRVATMGEQDRQAELFAFTDQVNRSLDVHAQQQAPHLHPKPPASTDEELAALGNEILQASVEGVDHGTALSLADQLNSALDQIQGDHLDRLDGLERRRVQAERGRRAKAKEQDSAARDLRALAGRLDGAATPTGR